MTNPASTFGLQIEDIASGCSASDAAVVSAGYEDAPEMSFTSTPSPQEEIVAGETEVLFQSTSSGNPADLTWSFGTGDSAFVPSPTYTFADTGLYSVVLRGTSAEAGCPDTVRLTYPVTGPDRLFVPNVFTPNGDGRNDAFTITDLGVSELCVQIYNRWGNLVFDNSCSGDVFEGVSNEGNEVGEGVYIYKIEYILAGETVKRTRTGTVTVIR
jgi:gliding motility-associated-like protein